VSLDPALSLLRQCADGPRYRPGLPSYCRKEKIIHAAVDLGWVTYSDGVVTMTDKGRRALAGETGPGERLAILKRIAGHEDRLAKAEAAL